MKLKTAVLTVLAIALLGGSAMSADMTLAPGSLGGIASPSGAKPTVPTGGGTWGQAGSQLAPSTTAPGSNLGGMVGLGNAQPLVPPPNSPGNAPAPLGNAPVPPGNQPVAPGNFGGGNLGLGVGTALGLVGALGQSRPQQAPPQAYAPPPAYAQPQAQPQAPGLAGCEGPGGRLVALDGLEEKLRDLRELFDDKLISLYDLECNRRRLVTSVDVQAAGVRETLEQLKRLRGNRLISEQDLDAGRNRALAAI